QAALEWAAGSAEEGLRLAVALWRYWWIRGYAAQGRAALEEALARVPAEHPALGRSMVRAHALDCAGALAHEQGGLAGAGRLLEESRALYRERGDPASLASALNNLGNVAYDRGRYGQARAFYGEALERYRQAGDARGSAMTLSNLGALADDLGEYDLA